MFEPPKQILVVGPAWVGDMVMAQSLLKLLAARYRPAHIDVLAPAWTRPLLERMPEVRETIPLDLAHGQLGLVSRFRTGLDLRSRHYEWAIVLPNSYKSALIPLWAKIPRRTGYLGEFRYGLLNDIRPLNPKALPMTVQRFVALGLEAGAPLPHPLPHPSLTVSTRGVKQTLDNLELRKPDTPLLVLCPGAEFGPAKRWPVSHFAAVARRKVGEGWTVWIVGSEKDRAIGEAIKAEVDSSQCHNLAGRTKLDQAIDILSLATTVISNDSGLMHVAAALRRSLIAVYGSSDPGFTPPLAANAKIVRLGLTCSPCFKRECPYGHYKCLQEIRPEHVLAAADHGTLTAKARTGV